MNCTSEVCLLLTTYIKPTSRWQTQVTVQQFWW